MSGPTGGRNSKAPTPEHPTPCVAPKLCPTRADWIITHRNIQRHGDDPKLYTQSFRTPEHPTPHTESVSPAGTSNAASETSNWGRYLRSVITQLLSNHILPYHPPTTQISPLKEYISKYTSPQSIHEIHSQNPKGQTHNILPIAIPPSKLIHAYNT